MLMLLCSHYKRKKVTEKTVSSAIQELLGNVLMKYT